MDKIKQFFKNTLLSFKYRLKKIHFNKERPFTKYHFRLWYLRLWMHVCMVGSGLVSLITLTFFEPNFTRSSSSKVAKQRGIVAGIERGDEPETKDDRNAKKEAFLKQFQKKNEYDSRGKYLGKEGDEDKKTTEKDLEEQ